MDDDMEQIPNSISKKRLLKLIILISVIIFYFIYNIWMGQIDIVSIYYDDRYLNSNSEGIFKRLYEIKDYIITFATMIVVTLILKYYNRKWEDKHLVKQEAEISEDECENENQEENEENKENKQNKKQKEFNRLKKKKLSIVKEEIDEETEN